MLQKERYPNLDFFVADFTTWTLKDDQSSMEHPFFSLAKNPDTTIRHYEHNGNTITIAPSAYGMPTIWDKYILIYCCSQLIEGMKRGRNPQREVVFPTFDILPAMNGEDSRETRFLIHSREAPTGFTFRVPLGRRVSTVEERYQNER